MLIGRRIVDQLKAKKVEILLRQSLVGRIQPGPEPTDVDQFFAAITLAIAGSLASMIH